jgi:hypothetical protein
MTYFKVQKLIHHTIKFLKSQPPIPILISKLDIDEGWDFCYIIITMQNVLVFKQITKKAGESRR